MASEGFLLAFDIINLILILALAVLVVMLFYKASVNYADIRRVQANLMRVVADLNMVNAAGYALDARHSAAMHVHPEMLLDDE
jgi:hypothetical protein